MLLIVLGIVGLLATTFFFYLPSYTRQLLMDFFTGTLREASSGVTPKFPWETPQAGTKVNMKAEIIVTSGGIFVASGDKMIDEKIFANIKPRIYEGKGTVPLHGAWAFTLRPRPGHIETMIRMTPQGAAIMAMADVDIAISDYLATKDPEKALHEKKKINDTVLAPIFGGLDDIASSPFENTWGVIISNPRLFDLTLSKRSQEAAEELFASRKFKEAVGEFKSVLGPDGDVNKAVDDLLLNLGKIKKNIFKVEDIDHITKSITSAIFKK